MQILFVRSNTFVSKAILFLTQEPVSHVAIKFGDKVFHTNFKGSHILSYEEFIKTYKVIYSVEQEIQEEILQQKIKQYNHKLYDYFSLVYLGIRYIGKKYLNVTLPKVNLWAVSGMYNCVELTSAVIYSKEYSMLTPYRMYLKLKDGQNK